MKRAFPGHLVVGALVLVGCPDDSKLENVIRQYVELRTERGATQCECYQLFLNLDEPGYPPFESEEECLATQPAGTEEGVECIKSVLASSSYDKEGSVEVMRCYNTVIRDEIQCMEPHISTCSESEIMACIESTAGPKSLCQGDLSGDEVSMIVNCAFK